MQASKLNDFKILVVDDEPLILNLVQGVLTNLGFGDVTLASSGRKAIEQISSKKFDFVITDWRMDDLDGLDIVRHVRRSRAQSLCTMPIIMLTGNSEAHYVKTAINAGVNSYIIKPFSAVQLVKRIRNIIEFPRDFILSDDFTGPDRRHVVGQPPDGVERRKRRR